jgi:hypothetical protein
VRRLSCKVAAVEQDVAPVADKAGDRVDERRLAGAVGADQAHELAGLDPKIDVDQGSNAAEAHGQRPCLEDGRHCGSDRRRGNDVKTITRIINNMLNTRRDGVTVASLYGQTTITA